MDSLKELEMKIKTFVEEREWKKYHTPENLAKSISIEANELLECFQWSNTEYDLEDVKDELADVFNYCIQLATVLNLDVKEIIIKKMEKNALKYPVDKCLGKSTKYNKL